MESTVKVIARTFETSCDTPDMLKHNLTILSGRAAGTCYAPDNYFSSGIHDEDKALSRAKMTANSGHHSVYDHGHITFQIETSKMMCMILNSLGVYATSEKSARYTQMKPETKTELDLYNKWLTIIQGLILSQYPDIDDVQLISMLKKKLKIESISVKNRELVITSISDDLKEQADKTLSEIKGSKQLHSYKLAQENARYMISVFTPTSMIYTVSYRQAMLTSQYLDRLVTDCKALSDRFSVRISKEAQTLSTALQAAIGGNVIEDNKDQYLRFLPYQHSGYEYEALRKTDYFGDSYTSTREMSMACLAQAQRHRTLRYTMYLQKPGQFGFYIPKIISESGMTLEWLNDMRSVEEIIPQGTLVRVTEQGIFEDFVLKCKERMCGRAQLEILKDTESLIYQFVKYKANLSMENKEILKDIFNYNTVCANARCKYSGFNCAEPCRWGAKHATTRYI